ncbi:anthranilate synthase component 2 [Anaeroplasma bactoclasticum]|uniref:Anthranilate synthase component 2 n=2 Tax=Anaeroplasma bactoclasticum TaxID=2088 RepID=A0A397RMW5_9MOLU|nr:anthranilate synthase component 2 [Anaeroplasma bactoclasticum]
MVILIDNYDSFSYNLYQFIGTINPDIEVYKNDCITVSEIRKKNPSHIILSPGPGIPKDAGIIEDILKEIHDIPILGVCLGHQAICEVFGLEITNAKEIYHGKDDYIDCDTESKLFKGLNNKLLVGRYHSLIGKGKSSDLRITAKNSDNEIMAVEHIKYPIYGVQFHPESILTPDGMQILENFFGGMKLWWRFIYKS